MQNIQEKYKKMRYKKIYIMMWFLQHKDHTKVGNSGINKEWHEMNQQCSLYQS